MRRRADLFANHLIFIILMLLLVAAAASAAEPDATVEQALRARSAGEYATAARLFRDALTQAPGRNDIRLLLAETLAWDKQFHESESVYRAVIAREPSSRPARLGLARVLLWSGRYAAARQAFSDLLRTNNRDIDSLEGRATAEYWSGDFRSAARDFQQVLRLDPSRDFSRRSAAEISAASAPLERFSAGYVDDDQPYRLFRADAAVTIASDPLTRWTAIAGAYRASAPVYGKAAMPFLRLENQTTFPALRLTASPWMGLVRYADGVIRPTGGLALSLRLTSHSTAIAGFDRQELLATATGMKSHPSVSTLHGGWRRESNDGWLAAVDASILRYFDGNRGEAAYAYALAPLLSTAGWKILGGASVTWRDSRDSRFEFAAVSSTRTPSGSFDYSYRGTYAPYWAPQKLREGRAIIVAQTAVRSAMLKIQADAGIARDRAIAFGPDTGGTPLPPFIYSIDFARHFHPYRVGLTASFPMSGDLACEIGFQSESTVFYRAKSIHASVVRHR